MRDSILLILLAAALAWLLWYMVRVPGEPWRAPLAPLSEDETWLAAALRGHVQAVASREHNMFKPEALEKAAQYVESALVQMGYKPLPQKFKTSMGEVRNIEVEVRGSGGEIVVVGAHYDSVAGAPGGNDNGSGVAAALELARRLREAKPERALRFVFFVNEEPPFFQGMDMGSRRYALRAKERNERIAAMLCLETIGWYSDAPDSQRFPFPLGFFYPSTGNFLAFVSNLGSRALLHEAIASFRRHARFPSEGVAAPALIPGVDWSDHASFWAQGYPALMLTDTAPYRYPHYHAATDTPDKVDYERLARVVVGLENMLRELAGVP
ncbi:MAG: M20/M25/M40 family metallo-hydrolase [Pseudomonadota bacterium]